MKKYLFLLLTLITSASMMPYVQAASTECPGDNAIECIISNFSEKKDVFGAIGNSYSVDIAFVDEKIQFLLTSKKDKKVKSCTAKKSDFFKIQSTLESVRDSKTPDFSYMECSDKSIEDKKYAASTEKKDPAQEKIPLKVKKLEVKNISTINLSFNQNIQHDTVQVRIVDPRDYKILPVKEYKKGTGKSVNIILEEPLEADTEYNLTINTALSESQATIERGIDSIQTFTTAKKLEWPKAELPKEKKEEIKEIETPEIPAVEIETPPAPAEVSSGAEIEYSKVHPEGKVIEKEIEEIPVPEKEAPVPEVVKEAETLPQTGMDATVLMVVVALCAAGILALRRKKI